MGRKQMAENGQGGQALNSLTFCPSWEPVLKYQLSTPPIPLVLGSFYYTSLTEPCLHGPFLFFKHAPALQMYKQRAEKCKCEKMPRQKRRLKNGA
jgi:hypothetical protein